ncbi:MAG: hypothetical protein RIT45_3713 [Pseudomonadota bacterium]|jgi:hypothetical protein
MMRTPHRLALSAALLLAATGCATDETASIGLYPTEVEGAVYGPTVVFEPQAQPEPEVPFPNDLAMRVAPGGTKYMSIGRDAPTKFERRLRHHVNEVPGFSAMSPISLSFDGPLDLSTVRDDTIFVVNVEPGHARFGEIVPLDLGRGYFPHKAEPHAYFPLDPLASYDSFVLPPDNKIDSDGDGVNDKWVYHYETATNSLDLRPLVPLASGARYAVVLTRAVEGFGESGVRGQIRSPFPGVNHEAQTTALELALPALAEKGVERKDIAFAWTFTTGDLSRTFRALREGLYGKGKFAWLADKISPRITHIYNMDIGFDGLADDMPGAHPGKKGYPFAQRDHDWILQGPFMDGIFKIIASFQPGVGGEFKYVSYAVFGDMTTVNLRATEQTDVTERNVWQIDLDEGTATVAEERVPFMITVPKTTAQHKPPFPVIVYAHATGTSRIEALLLADRFARAGIATFTIDAVGHGPVLANAKELIVDFFKGDEGTAKSLVKALLGSYVFTDADTRFPDDMSLDEMIGKIEQNGFMQQLIVKGRGTDDNGDCILNDSAGEAYYAPNTIRLRDSMRQTTLDYIVAVRMLRSLGQNVPAAIDDPRTADPERLKQNLLAGDFDADGVADIGGPDVPYFMMGISLGGIHTALTAPLEPYIVAAAPVVAGAGIADIFIRTKLHGVIEKLMWKASGPMLVGCPGKGDAATTPEGLPNVRLSWNDESDACKRETKKSYVGEGGVCLKQPQEVPTWVAELGLHEGARLILDNLTTGESAEGVAGKDGRFAIALATDIGDDVRLRVMAEDGRVLREVALVSPVEGAARPRNTPRFRRLVQLNSNVLEGADAITVADRMFLDTRGAPATNVLLSLAVGDRTVPFAAGLALARAIGLFGPLDDYVDDKPWRAWTDEAIRRGLLDNSVGDKVAAGEITDAERLPPLLNPSAEGTGFGNCRTVKTESGVSGLCLANVGGRHEYIAQVDKNDQHPPLDGYTPSYTEYHRNLIVNYFHSLGTRIVDDPCWADWKCVQDKGLAAAWDAPVGKK